MRIAVLGAEQSWYVKELKRAIGARGHHYERLEFSRLVGQIVTNQELLLSEQHDLQKHDAIIVRSMPPGSLEQVVFRMDALARLEFAGANIINPPKSLECAIDKYLTTSKLAAAGLPVPKTIVCENEQTALAAFEQLERNVVVKPVFGSEGRGILHLSDPDLAMRTFRTLERLQCVIYLQQRIAHTGCDVRVLVLNGKVLGGMKRFSPDDFRTNVARSAKAERHTPTDTEAEYALRAVAAAGVKFAGVDLLYDEHESCYVLEVNGVPGWRAFERVNAMPLAELFIQEIETGF